MTDTDPNPLALLFVSALIGGISMAIGYAFNIVELFNAAIIGLAIAGCVVMVGALSAAGKGAI